TTQGILVQFSIYILIVFLFLLRLKVFAFIPYFKEDIVKLIIHLNKLFNFLDRFYINFTKLCYIKNDFIYPIIFFLKTISKLESNYPIYNKELLTIIYTIEE
ncbi:uncharacterized protein THITE_2043103, partial [Thermothielavioides terrestris NRRL 8126]